MKQLARALVNAAAFLELSEDDVVDPDSAVKAMEEIAYDLSTLSAAEYATLEEVCSDLANEARSIGFSDKVHFCESFLNDFGVQVGDHA
jgi:hypothetical protein